MHEMQHLLRCYNSYVSERPQKNRLPLRRLFARNTRAYRTQTSGSITVVAALSVAALLIAMVYQFTKPNQNLERGRIVINPPIFVIPIPEEDSDGDGVPNWQEKLIGTDPKNKDTDGDGEVDTYKSILYTQSEITLGGSASSTIILSPADELGNRLISEYASLKQSGAYTNDRGVLIGEKLANSIRQITPFEPRILEDIKSDPDTSYERMISYRSAMQDIFSPLLSLNEAEFVIYGKFVENKDRVALGEFLDIADVYQEVADAAAEIIVPIDAVDQHLDAVNALSFYAEVLRNMVRYSYDSVASFALLRTYAQADQYLITTFNSLSLYYVLKYQEKYGN
jgi:hypothetical protein